MADKDKAPGSENQQVTNPNPSDAKTYSKAELDKEVEKAVREATGKMGQKHKLEKDGLTDKVTKLTGENASLKGTVESQKMEVETVNKTLDELSADDPDKKNIARLTRDLTSAKKGAQSEKRENAAANATAKAENDADRAKIDADRREVFIAKIAAEHKDGTAEALTEICDTFGVGADEEKIRAAAGTKWVPLGEETTTTTVPVDSQDTSGGDHLSDEDFMKSYSEGKIDDHERAEKILANIS